MTNIQLFSEFSTTETGPFFFFASLLLVLFTLFRDRTIKESAGAGLFPSITASFISLTGFWQLTHLRTLPVDMNYVFLMASIVISVGTLIIDIHQRSSIEQEKADESETETFIAREPKDRRGERAPQKGLEIPQELLDLKNPHEEWLDKGIQIPSKTKKLVSEPAH